MIHLHQPEQKKDRWLLKYVITGLIGALIGAGFSAITPIATAIGGGAVDSDVVSDGLRGGQPIVVQVEKFSDKGRHAAHWAFANPPHFSVDEVRELNSPEPNGATRDDPYRKLVQARGGVELGPLDANFTLIGKREQGVRIKDIRVTIMKKTAPLSGGLICQWFGGADDDTVRTRVDLDGPAPIVEIKDKEGDTWASYGKTHTVSLARRERVTINMVASTKKNYVEFYVDVDYVVGDGEAGTARIDDVGAPFAITAPASPLNSDNTFSVGGYQEVWSHQRRFGDLYPTTPTAGESCSG